MWLLRVEAIVLSLRCSGVDLFTFWGCFCLVCYDDVAPLILMGFELC